jgi:hypothetical protein
MAAFTSRVRSCWVQCASWQHDRSSEVGNELRQIRDELVHAAEAHPIQYPQSPTH